MSLDREELERELERKQERLKWLDAQRAKDLAALIEIADQERRERELSRRRRRLVLERALAEGQRRCPHCHRAFIDRSRAERVQIDKAAAVAQIASMYNCTVSTAYRARRRGWMKKRKES